jgi:hypothetical protein
MALARLDHHAAAFVDPDVCDQRSPGIVREKDEIAAPQASACGIAFPRLLNGAPRQLDAEPAEDVLSEPGTVERAGTLRAPHVRPADQTRSERDGIVGRIRLVREDQERER